MAFSVARFVVQRSEYRRRAYRVQLLGVFVYFGVAAPLFALVAAAAEFLIGAPNAYREFLATFVAAQNIRSAVYVSLTPAFLLPFPFAAWLIRRLDQRIGIKCPQCCGSLSIRCHPDEVAGAGSCPHCGQALFE